jgi:thioredoxin 1
LSILVREPPVLNDRAAKPTRPTLSDGDREVTFRRPTRTSAGYGDGARDLADSEASWQQAKNVFEFTEQNFDAEVLKSDTPVLVDFTATWCGPCKQLAPIIDRIADDFAGKIKIGKLDIDANPQITAKYGVRSVPTVIVFKGGQKVVANAGLVSREKLLALLGVS